MARTAEAESHSTAAAIRELAFSTEPFSERVREVMAILRECVPSETVNLGTIDFQNGEGSYHSLDGFLMPPQRRALLPFFLDEHPMLCLARKQGFLAPMRFTDFHTRREFEEKAIFRECYRGFIHSMLTFSVPSPRGINVGFVLSRASGEFSDQECARVAWLKPAIVYFMDHALSRAVREMGSSCRRLGAMVGCGPRIQHLDAEAERLLRTHFPGRARHHLPDPLTTALADSGGIPHRICRTGARTLYAEIRGNFASWTIGLTEALGTLGRRGLSELGLSRLETEILEWVSRERSNRDIGMILGVRAGIVEEVVLRLMSKLGVSSRGEAAERFRQSGEVESTEGA